MKVEIYEKMRGDVTPCYSWEVDQVTAATEKFPYWVFWFSPTENGFQRVEFLNDYDVGRVTMVDKVQPDDKESGPHLRVVPFPGGDKSGPVSQD